MNAQQALADAEVTGTAGGGLVKATVNGQGELMDLTIAAAAVDTDDPEETARTIADLVLAAVRDAYGQPTLGGGGRDEYAAAMQGGGLPGGLNLPSGLDLSGLGIGAPGGSDEDPDDPDDTDEPETDQGPDVYEGVIQNLIDELGRLPGSVQGCPADRLSPAGRGPG